MRGNNKQHDNKELRKEIMLRTNLKKKANKTKKEEDVRRYRKQRNLIVRMNKKAKREYYKSISPKSIDNDRKFWKMVKPMFSTVNPIDLLAILQKSLDRALSLYIFIHEVRSSGMRGSITIKHIRKSFKVHHNIVRFRFFPRIAKRSMSDKIILIEDEKIITDDTEIAESFNTYFLNITDSVLVLLKLFLQRISIQW